MGAALLEIQQPDILVVEGKEDQLFFAAVAAHLGAPDIQILPIGGKTRLRENLKALALAPRFATVRSLGIIRDADAAPNIAFQSVRDALKAARLPAPAAPMQTASGPPATAVMILPDSHSSGTLEDLVLRAVQSDPAMRCVDGYFDCLVRECSLRPGNTAEAKVAVYLASKKEAAKRLGEAAQAGYIPWDSAAFDEAKRFLTELLRMRP
jgi:hypothetical protein